MGFLDQLLSGILDQTQPQQSEQVRRQSSSSCPPGGEQGSECCHGSELRQQQQGGSNGNCQTGEKGSALYESLKNTIAQLGGVGGLVQQFQQNGLGPMITGWVGTGANPAISGDQISKVFGPEKISSMASVCGLTEEQVTQGIAKLLPVIIDKLTPGGNVSANQTPNDLNQAFNSLRSTFLG